MRGADGDRAVFYAACRELQGAGAALLRAGKVYRPDQVMALVSDAEAAKAAEAVRALSGWTGMDGGTAQRTDFPAGNTAGDSAGAGEAADTGASSEASDGRAPDNGRSRGQRFDHTADGTDEGAGGQDSHEADKKAEIRPAVVQVNAEVRREAVQKKTADAAFRPDTVREKAGKNAEIRHRSVHGEKAGGQASCEFLAEYGEPLPPDGKTQVLPEKSPDAPQNVGVSDKMDGSLQKTEREFLSERAAPEDGYALGLHESKSEINGQDGASLHEITSEDDAKGGKALHESKSEIDGRGGANLHESESENGAGSGNARHEGESEITETLHETTTELAERVARELLDGLRRAAWVR